ncbi:MAG: hypothetical protein KGP29_07795 [Proteobacteria bacterium]|nr:hypothetical protein [Pseudomonadota bacterium]
MLLLSTVILWHHSLGWIVLSLIILKISKSEKLKVVATNVIVIFSMVLLLEASFVVHNKLQGGKDSKEEGGYLEPWQTVEKIGYQFHVPNSAVKIKRSYGDEVIYDVTYNFDQNGLRVTSNDNKARNNNDILFFGCSFAFGEGLNDSDTFPFQLIEKTKNTYDGHNFAFHGYGAHQMLALLEDKKFVNKVVDKAKVKYVFYEMIPDHIKRVAGHHISMIWGISSPRYEIQNDEAVYTGSFKDYYEKNPKSRTRKFLIKYVHDLGRSRSYFINYLVGKAQLNSKLKGFKMSVDEKDSELLVKIVEKSSKIVEKDYGAKFYTIIWDDTDEQEVNYIKTRFDQIGVKYFLVSEIIKDIKDTKKYFMEHDGHPKGLTNEVVADFVFREALSK